MPEWRTDVDHIIPVTSAEKYSYEMDPHEILDKIFCADNNLANLCQLCHSSKTARERRLKKEFRKGKK